MTRIVETKRLLAASAVIAALSMTFAGDARGTSIVDPGFNLFQTTPVTAFFFGAPVPNPQFVDLEGIPLGTFDFGSGPIGVPLADTIIERMQFANLGGGSDTIDIELVALSLVSTTPIDLGFGAGFEDIFITLNTSSPSIQSTMTILDTGEGQPHGTFESLLNFSFDVTGSVGGFYVTLEKTIETTPAVHVANDAHALVEHVGGDAHAPDQHHLLWQHEPTGTQPQLINGVNHLLNTVNESKDFWPDGFVIHDDGTGTAIHTAVAAPIPEPHSAVLFGIGALVVGVALRKKAVA